MNRKSAIGIFDSGLGGLTVMSAVTKLLPKENIIYFGDTAHVPYGSKSNKVVTGFALAISKFLVKHDVKLIIVACNTASAFSLADLKKKIKVPVIGVITAGSAMAVKNTKNKRVAVIGTEGTIKSGAYLKEIKKQNKSVKVFSQACPLFVPLVEEGWFDAKITKDIIKEYLTEILKKKTDTIILGCTHYPLLKKSIQKVIGGNVEIIDSAIAIANEVKNLLHDKNIENDAKQGRHVFYVSDCPEKFEKLGSIFFGKKIKNVKKVELEK
ncbi:MAG: glutamate racemase [Endomicrobiaceae bacterium]|jgi:glutamate racemase|nr:glutamate racemase [Endomicrobiaceae bacterium]MDD3729402.1 glutamate racemase [Endomicrobiaceae bacterium]MDD4165428.1 glutamate racemase [Endomicrobiaceae bacterium]